mmetsp:Transcript_47187/g.95244  ORF Transcript_47187/g.95244 Transcript_47187/m.95244 type:complete len:193 (-) Transcript_47187:275-853(-)
MHLHAPCLACCVVLAGATSTPISVDAISKIFHHTGDFFKDGYAKYYNYTATFAACKEKYGNQCCAKSGCWELAGQGCRGDRGATMCVGSSSVPVKRGVCACKYGACDSTGTCSQDPSTWHMMQDAFAGNASVATRLDGEALRGRAPQTAGLALAAGLSALAAGGLVAAGRAALRRRRGRGAEVCGREAPALE